MPKVYLTLAERRRAEQQRAAQKENFMLSAVLKTAICRRIGYDYISAQTNLSKPTIVKVVNHPEQATVAQLRAVCAAANIPVNITAAYDESI